MAIMLPKSRWTKVSTDFQLPSRLVLFCQVEKLRKRQAPLLIPLCTLPNCDWRLPYWFS